jgi:hypothetical protein
MKNYISIAGSAFAVLALSLIGLSSYAWGDAGHDDDSVEPKHMMEQMREMHRGHEHGHDFEAMEEMSPEEMRHMMESMWEVGLALPPMDSHRGRMLFLQKGCVICHAVNGVGGEIGPSLNATDMPEPMNVFEFAARMWRGASAMVQLQDDLLGEVISLSGQDLADLVAFAHDESEQRKLDAAQIPDRFRPLIDQ